MGLIFKQREIRICIIGDEGGKENNLLSFKYDKLY